MARIQMTDHNSSDSGLMEELTNEELLDEELLDEDLKAINGGSCGCCKEYVWSIGPSVPRSDSPPPPYIDQTPFSAWS